MGVGLLHQEVLVLDESRPVERLLIRGLASPPPENADLWFGPLMQWNARTVALVSEGHCGTCGERLIWDELVGWSYCSTSAPGHGCRTAWRMLRMELGDFLGTAHINRAGQSPPPPPW